MKFTNASKRSRDLIITIGLYMALREKPRCWCWRSSEGQIRIVAVTQSVPVFFFNLAYFNHTTHRALRTCCPRLYVSSWSRSPKAEDPWEVRQFWPLHPLSSPEWSGQQSAAPGDLGKKKIILCNEAETQRCYLDKIVDLLPLIW